MSPLAAAVPVVTALALSTGLTGGGAGRVEAPAVPAGALRAAPDVDPVQAADPATGARALDDSRRDVSAAGPVTRTSQPGRWGWPLEPRPAVVRRFEPPATTWGRGHRGVDLAGAKGQQVLAVEPGTVSHVGVVAGRPTVSVVHGGGLRSTYEPVAASVAVGDSVAAGGTLGTLESVGSHCPTRACLHLGALRGRSYLDPLSLLSTPRIRLLPLWR
jgi:murein DD-endopeptidase MepM/ murein hydrolase activator NlpD